LSDATVPVTGLDAAQHFDMRHQAALSPLRIRVCFIGRGAMTYAIHASKNGQSVVTIRIKPVGAVDKARLLESLGWQVHITDSAGHQFNSRDFDRFLFIEKVTT
jgi:hypothetical protein